jgi:hypothetical protein
MRFKRALVVKRMAECHTKYSDLSGQPCSNANGARAGPESFQGSRLVAPEWRLPHPAFCQLLAAANCIVLCAGEMKSSTSSSSEQDTFLALEACSDRGGRASSLDSRHPPRAGEVQGVGEQQAAEQRKQETRATRARHGIYVSHLCSLRHSASFEPHSADPELAATSYRAAFSNSPS